MKESKPMTKKTAYFYFVLCIFFEQIGNLFISFTDGFTVLLPSLACLLFYGLCYACFAKSLKVINLAIGFAVWSGVSIIVIACIDMLILHAHLNWADFVGMAIIIVGIVGMNLNGSQE
ncbi:MAG: multidrug efflux SMR transporter [Firmicutes bacterium]|nr:multidrug efflux SMR transporter [Bacillota bacterium]MBQ9016604.1 multidrug efflux SMR transporter [Bacillota bacterium]